MPWSSVLQEGGVHTDTIISDPENEAFSKLQLDKQFARLRVHAGVAHRFMGDAKDLVQAVGDKDDADVVGAKPPQRFRPPASPSLPELPGSKLA